MQLRCKLQEIATQSDFQDASNGLLGHLEEIKSIIARLIDPSSQHRHVFDIFNRRLEGFEENSLEGVKKLLCNDDVVKMAEAVRLMREHVVFRRMKRDLELQGLMIEKRDFFLKFLFPFGIFVAYVVI